jgi:hypothetical protein
MHGSGNRVFAAPVPAALCDAVEKELIWSHGDQLIYNNFGKKTVPANRLTLRHRGAIPAFSERQS